MDYKEVFTRYLNSQGLRLTTSRELILEAVFATHSHFDVEKLYESLKEDKKKVSRATIYRTIPYLLNAGLIRKSFCDDQREEYEHIYGHPNHLHLQCVICGRIVEQSDKEIEAAIEKIAKHHVFTIRDYSLGIKGLCSLCRKD